MKAPGGHFEVKCTSRPGCEKGSPSVLEVDPLWLWRGKDLHADIADRDQILLFGVLKTTVLRCNRSFTMGPISSHYKGDTWCPWTPALFIKFCSSSGEMKSGM